MLRLGKTMNEKIYGAVDIGGTKIQVGLVSEKGEFFGVTRFPTDSKNQSGEEAVTKISDSLLSLCESAGFGLSALSGIGVFCAGPVDTEKGTVENPYTLPGWEGLPLVGLLSDATGLKVKLENDANGALLGEVFTRKLSKKRVLMVTLGTGIGVAFWNGEELYRAGRFHPEMGHIIVSGEGEECYCGHRGCFESLCSGSAVNLRAEKAGFSDFDKLSLEAKSGNPLAEETLNKILADFKNGIWTLRVIFKPDVLVLAGGFAKNYFPLLKNALSGEKENLEDFTGAGQIVSESDVPNAALVGVCMLQIEKD